MKKILITCAIAMMATLGFAQRFTDKVDRGLVAMKVNSGVFLSWRVLGEEYYDVTYNVYRDGDKINTTPLKTSNYTKVSGVPVFITLAMLRQNPDRRLFPSQGQNVAYLLKGTFPSLYANRINPEISESKEMQFKAESVPTAMIVVADGDVIRNQIDILTKKPLPLGYDQYTQNTYGNKDFIVNAIHYLVDGENLIAIRSREFKIRLLDPDKKVNQQLRWQLVNILIPVGMVILFGLIVALVRKKKYNF